ncbi:MAG: DUF5110 domain-containing protein [Eubacterium sp.]|nr:DUF5110 domain-containing protein [Eubacterium sp.]
MKFNHTFELTENSGYGRVYSCDDNIARLDFLSGSLVRIAVYKKGDKLLNTYNICPDGNMDIKGRERLSTQGFELYSPSACEKEGKHCFTLENGVEARLDLHNFIISFYKNSERLFSDRAPLAYNFDGEFGRDFIHYITREKGEKVYGLGDKGGELNKSGRAFKLETVDTMGFDAEKSDPLYKHIPFYICENSVSSYGIFYDTSATSTVNLGAEHNNYYEPYKYFQTEDNCIVCYVFFGTKLEVLKQFSSLTGKQAFAPKWSFDYCASTMAYTDAPDSEVQMRAFVEKLKSLDLNCQGFYLSSGYTSIGDQRFVFNWNYDKFPDPKKFVEFYNSNNIKIIPNIKPAFLENHPMYEELKSKGWFVKNEDGTPFLTQFWDGLGSYLDFTNEGAYNFWVEQVTEKLLDNSIICTWNDNNEYDIRDNGALADGFGNFVQASRIRPDLTYLMNTASYKAQISANPDIRPFLSSRSGNIGVRRFAQTWSGDNRTNFKDLRYCHYIGMTMSMSGLYFYGHDLGGFSGDMPSRELLLRWLQHGLFEPRFTIHSWNDDGSSTMPWSYEDIIPYVKEIFAQRKQLIPYFYNCAYRAVEYDEPMNAPLFMYYDDAEISDDSNSFMLGRDILASCVFDEGEDTVRVWLPGADDWYLGDRIFEGGQYVNLNIPARSKMPYFVRAGSIVATDEGEPGFNKDEKLTLTVYPLKSGEFKAEFFTDDGESFDYLDGKCTHLYLTVACNENEVYVSAENKGSIDFDGEIKLCSADDRKLIIK